MKAEDMNSIYGAHCSNDKFTDILIEKLKTESLEELEARTGLTIVFFNGVNMQNEKVIICKAVRVWEDTPGFKEETEKRVAELFGMPVECEASYGEHYCPGDPVRSF
jgi:hypothetical protein